MTPAEFIDQKGGPAAMTRAINELLPPTKQLGSGAIALWRHRNKIPRTSWPEIIDAFPGTTLDELKAVEAAGESAGEVSSQEDGEVSAA